VRRSSRRTAISAIKRHEERDSLVIRLYNLTGADLEERLRFGLPVRRAWRLDLLENRTGALPSDKREVRIRLGPFAIETVEMELTRAGSA
jgi:alpha-mannosidase